MEKKEKETFETLILRAKDALYDEIVKEVEGCMHSSGEEDGYDSSSIEIRLNKDKEPVISLSYHSEHFGFIDAAVCKVLDLVDWFGVVTSGFEGDKEARHEVIEVAVRTKFALLKLSEDIEYFLDKELPSYSNRIGKLTSEVREEYILKRKQLKEK